MEISQTTAVQTQPSRATAKSGRAISSDFETFLKMLTVQMQNQDPLSPIKSEDFAVQLATFSGVEQQVRTNDLLTALSDGMGASGIGQFADWVGKEARAPAAGYFDGSPITVLPSPMALADQAVLVVRDPSGAEVQRRAIAVSDAPLDWAGVASDGSPFSPGTYQFQVESYAKGTLIGTSTAATYGKIVEARMEGGQAVLVLQGGAKVPTSSVTALRAPD
jgi:flagellar basal-body rod modification protein FlgD